MARIEVDLAAVTVKALRGVIRLASGSGCPQRGAAAG
jgi:hypothetical protein